MLLLPSLSEMAFAHPTTSGDKLHRRATKANRPLSTVVIIVIVVAVIGTYCSPTILSPTAKSRIPVLLLALAAIIYFYYRKRSKSQNNKPVPMNSIGQGRPVSTLPRQQGDWWQPPVEAEDNTSSVAHTNAPYSQGGHGYRYGNTLDPASAGGNMAGTRTSVGSHAPHSTEVETDRPFQIPISANRPPPSPSISPSYHTFAGEDEQLPPRLHNPTPFIRPPPPSTNPPPGAFQPRPEIAYLQPQTTGTSMYSSPYEVTAMTQSTSGHPGT